MGEGKNLSRRSFVATGALLVTTGCIGMSTFSLTSCTTETANQQPEFRVDNGKFYIDGTEEGIVFSGSKISLIPNAAVDMITVHYQDASGAPATKDFLPLGESFVVNGNHDGMITVDAFVEEDASISTTEADIGVLSLGAVNTAELNGSFDHVVAFGNTNIILGDEASVGEMTLAHGAVTTEISEDASLGQVAAVEEVMVPSEASSDETIAHEEAIELHGAFSEEFREEASTAESGAVKFNEQGIAVELVENLEVDSGSENNDPPADGGEVLADSELSEQEAEESLAGTEQELSAELMSEIGVGDTQVGVSFENEDELGALASGLEILLSGLSFIGKGAAGAVISYGTTTVLQLILGKSDSSAEILQKLDDVKKHLSEIERQIAEIANMLVKMEYATQVNNYLTKYSSTMRAGILFLDGYVANIDKGVDGEQKAADQKQFADSLLTKDEYKVNGNWIQKMTLILGEELLQTYVGTNTNLFGAMDGLARYAYRWEHQAYSYRSNFQLSILAVYTTLLAYSKLALNKGIADTKDNPQKRDIYFAYLTDWENLFGSASIEDADYFSNSNSDGNKAGNLAQVLEIANKQKVTVRDNSVRYYQVPGHEILMTATAAVMGVSAKGGISQTQFMRDAAGHNVLTQEQYTTILQDYGKSKSLTEILFDKQEGNIAPPSDTSLMFAGYSQPLIKVSHPHINPASTSRSYFAPVVDKGGNLDKKQLVWTRGGRVLYYKVNAIGVFRA
ncbi:MAG: hypothetical protein ACOYD7_06220 [Raoultibacter sp.]|jgi:hypothetical protein